MKNAFLVTLVGLALLVFGLVQFSSVSSSPEIIQNLTIQGYAGWSLYTAPVFVSSYLLFIVGAVILFLSGGFK